jgi:hypothetical protein
VLVCTNSSYAFMDTVLIYAAESSSGTSGDNDDDDGVSMGVVIGILSALIVLVAAVAIGVAWWYGFCCFQNNGRGGENTKEERLI